MCVGFGLPAVPEIVLTVPFRVGCVRAPVFRPSAINIYSSSRSRHTQPYTHKHKQAGDATTNTRRQRVSIFSFPCVYGCMLVRTEQLGSVCIVCEYANAEAPAECLFVPSFVSNTHALKSYFATSSCGFVCACAFLHIQHRELNRAVDVSVSASENRREWRRVREYPL